MASRLMWRVKSDYMINIENSKEGINRCLSKDLDRFLDTDQCKQ